MKSKDWDKRICILLFVIRTAFTIPYLIIRQISVEYISVSETSICYYKFIDIAPYDVGGIILEAREYYSQLLQEGPSMTVKCITYILLSYLITIDAEIVHAIEVVSMKRLSFFECASTVLKNENDDDDRNHENDEIKDDDENEDNDRKINDTEISNMEIITH
ncbi:hypothetical protein GLOIN_2v1778626 [Rhizophagus irregularis DAOM 181602=DAOM 197198]|uniref:Uncharacterized protein n=1 Tax=Rhizophagus irregularis (strain DAOM 181602 / DAOM 197198 / MUCL 43194) TaxID=747089 RepID=A0A2P4PRT9_RHIID|nr:hypothetical protein GLOIN_2v1778626 [Rhizophagus irregularis DAOM 181602=DAOM 197198]POG68119.1 hypothetical protein GLOIN_2v1778626 [Rhizophagus irregularis DAOM 181602=DAOM 197198]|eukprot:XP_025174985.1 hypothetical protein GLOIN_2v1778626 [Rhizophagus irregularis DAOM 181602=DAOM 197198]